MGFNMNLFATTMGVTFADAQRKSKEGTAKSERQQNIQDTMLGYRLMWRPHDGSQVTPATLTPTFEKILSLSDVGCVTSSGKAFVWIQQSSLKRVAHLAKIESCSLDLLI